MKKKDKKVLIIGLGSIGKRHLAVLRELCSPEILSWESGFGHRGRNFDRDHKVKSFNSLDEVIKEKPDFAIVSNPTRYHFHAANKLAKSRIPFLIEKPVSDSINELDKLARVVKKESLPVLVGYNLRYHPLIQKAKSLIEEQRIGDVYSLQAEVGYTLKRWRPGRDYRDMYSAHKGLGGGVILDLSHEIDLAVYFMGKVTKVSCEAGRLSKMKIDSEDTAEIILWHGWKKLSSIHLDCIQNVYSRNLKLVGSKGTLIWDYPKGKLILRSYGRKDRVWQVDRSFDRNEMYRKQMKHFLKVIAKKEKPHVSLSEGNCVSKIAIECRKKAGLIFRK